jgi:Rieske Fe-S protein
MEEIIMRTDEKAEFATRTPRRTVLAGAAGLGAVALVGCAPYGSSTANPPPPPPVAEPPPTPTPASNAEEERDAEEPEEPEEPPADAGPPPLARIGDVPVGGGVILDDVVLTQPEGGVIRAFSASCTHQGCLVTQVQDGTINCPCHGSRFRVADGSVAAGPAPGPLPAVAVAVDGDAIRLA